MPAISLQGISGYAKLLKRSISARGGPPHPITPRQARIGDEKILFTFGFAVSSIRIESLRVPENRAHSPTGAGCSIYLR